MITPHPPRGMAPQSKTGGQKPTLSHPCPTLVPPYGGKFGTDQANKNKYLGLLSRLSHPKYNILRMCARTRVCICNIHSDFVGNRVGHPDHPIKLKYLARFWVGQGWDRDGTPFQQCKKINGLAIKQGGTA